jgi:hypothetical protein
METCGSDEARIQSVAIDEAFNRILKFVFYIALTGEILSSMSIVSRQVQCKSYLGRLLGRG